MQGDSSPAEPQGKPLNQGPHPLFARGPAGSAGQGDRTEGSRATLRPETAPQSPARAGTRDSRQGHGEVEALPQSPEGDEGLRREAPGGHLAVGPLERTRGAHAVEAADEQVHTGAPVLAHAVGAAAGARVHLAVLAWGDGAGERGSHGSLGGGRGEGHPTRSEPPAEPGALLRAPLRKTENAERAPCPPHTHVCTTAGHPGALRSMPGSFRAPPAHRLPRRPTAPRTTLGSDPVIKSVPHTGPQLCSNGLPVA